MKLVKTIEKHFQSNLNISYTFYSFNNNYNLNKVGTVLLILFFYLIIKYNIITELELDQEL